MDGLQEPAAVVAELIEARRGRRGSDMGRLGTADVPSPSGLLADAASQVGGGDTAGGIPAQLGAGRIGPYLDGELEAVIV